MFKNPQRGKKNCAHDYNLSCPFHSDLRDYDCHVENSSEVLSESTRRMSILLQGIGEDRLLRLTRRQSIYVKAVIICVLLPCALAFIVFVIFEVPFPCPCPGWSQQCNCIQKCKRQGEERTENPNSVSSEGSVMRSKNISILHDIESNNYRLQ
ncbi:uncharacterized protein C17orf78 homolog isoform X1 [Gopherus evgoodei]|uniref:uncharacterized protein C17orf78 homolog isoform X1 n=1 Tax=Gopherus evgoodei TaxID=1825980 RepID=UPI0011CFFEEB|nr:uncharacterized protein C17orf78 homolog isoform X1 [Gopherus evgoodei]